MSFDERSTVMQRSIALVAVALVTALGAAATAAYAAAPTKESVSIDETFTWDDCGFALQEHDEGTLSFITWFDASGTRTRQLVVAPGFKITWTNPATGKSVTSPNPFVVNKRDNPDGSVTVAFSGLVFAIPGGGQAHVDSGRDVLVFSDGGIEVVSSVGPTDDLCDALEAAIG
jgi:hypothetical protein